MLDTGGNALNLHDGAFVDDIVVSLDSDQNGVVVAVGNGLLPAHDLLNSVVLLVELGGGAVLDLHVGNLFQVVNAVLHGVLEPGVGSSGLCQTAALQVAALDIDSLHGAIGEDSQSLIDSLGQNGAAAVIANDEHEVVVTVNLTCADHIAIGIQIQIEGSVVQLLDIVVVQNLSILESLLSGLILVAAGSQLGQLILNLLVSIRIAGGVRGDGNILNGLNGSDGHDVALGNGDQNHVVFLQLLQTVHVLRLDGVGGADGGGSFALLGSILHTSVDVQTDILGLGVVVSRNLSQIGVDDNDSGLLSVGVHIDLSQNTLAGGIHGIIVFLDQLVSLDREGLLVQLHAVNPVGQGEVASVGADVGIDIAALDLSGVGSGQQVGVDIVADILLVIGPVVGGTAEVVGIVGADQLLEVLLAELDIAVLLDLAVVQGALVPGQVLADAGDGNSGAALADNDAVVILDHGSLQGVEGIQASLFTSDSLDTVEAALQALVQAGVDSLLGNSDGPVGAGVAFDGRVIAQSAQQHLHEGIAGQGGGGLEGAVSVTGDDAFLLAVSNVASEGVVGGDVLVRSGVSHQSGGGGGAKDQVADDLGSSATGQGGGGTEVTFGIAVDDLHGGHHVDSFRIRDLAAVGEVLGTSRDGDQRHGHHQSQYQRKELLHGVSSF